MRKFVVLVAGVTVLIAGCSASTSAASSSRSGAAHTSASVQAVSATPTVGPTDPSQSPKPQPAAVSLQVVKRNGATLVLAPITIHGKAYPFVVDTGASATLISSAYMKRLGLKATGQAPIPVAGVTGSGNAQLATISDWAIGRSRIPTSTITVTKLQIGSGLVGLLGSDVLSTFGKVTIDYKQEKATLG